MTSRSDIDAQVAENVMGWRVSKSGWYKRADNGIHVSQYQGEWHPTADIKQAWMVVDKMTMDGWDFRIDSNGLAQAKSKWHAVFEMVSDELQFHYAFTETETMAICLAALKACADNHEND